MSEEENHISRMLAQFSPAGAQGGLEVAIYGERDSDGILRYIGKAVDIRRRRRTHLQEAAKGSPGRHYNWIRSLSAPPTTELLARAPADAWEEAERYWIALARAYGCDLTNLTDGGDCGPSLKGRPVTAAARRNMSAAQRKVKKTPEQLERIAALNRGKPFSPEHLRNLIIAHQGQRRTQPQIELWRAATFRRGPRRDNTTGYKGVTPSFGRYQARACIDGIKQRSLGYFSTAVEAAAAVDRAVMQYQPADSYLNFPFIPYGN